ncbi:hypothetical protein ACFL1W_00480 [Candidatus Margulisiibacteriota bacterium]
MKEPVEDEGVTNISLDVTNEENVLGWLGKISLHLNLAAKGKKKITSEDLEKLFDPIDDITMQYAGDTIIERQVGQISTTISELIAKGGQ